MAAINQHPWLPFFLFFLSFAPFSSCHSFASQNSLASYTSKPHITLMVNAPEEFNVETADWSRLYRQLINSWRQELTVRYSHNRPVLAVQPENPSEYRYFDLTLRTNTNHITLRIRRDNLYMDGFHMDQNRRWFEFLNEHNRHLIDPNSVFFPFDGQYIHIEGGTGVTRRRNLPLGQNRLRDAVNYLAVNGGQNTAQRAESLLVVIQMISEAIRFTYISDELVRASGFNEVAQDTRHRFEDLENGWASLSSPLLLADIYPNQSFTLPANNMGVGTLEEAAAILGILVVASKLSQGGGRVVRNAVAGNDVDVNIGAQLVEVFSVRINNIDGEDPGDLYGSITVEDGFSSQYIFNLGREDYVEISPRDDILLSGPARAISGYDSFIINFNLWDRDADLSPDDEISKGMVAWNQYSIDNVFDKHLDQTIAGKYGSATVTYAVLSDAVHAKIEVKLINGDGEDPADVYGDIYASNTIGDTILFAKNSKQHIDVRPSQLIPLSKSIMAVPLEKASLTVSAKLYDHDPVSSDDEIANGRVVFTPYISGAETKTIYGRYGQVEVKVTWKIYY